MKLIGRCPRIPQVEVDELLIDAMAMRLVKDPESLEELEGG